MKKAVIDAGRELLRSGLTVETWGNLSLRDPETGLIYITPSGMDYMDCTEEDVVVLTPDGAVAQGRRRPSTEKELHLRIYAARADVNAIVHTHPIYSTVLGCLGQELPLFLDEAAQTLGGAVRVCPYALPGTKELAEHCVGALGESARACLLRAHGAVCVGGGMREAFRVARVLEMAAEISWRLQAIGHMPQPLAPEHIRAMQDFARSGYGQNPEGGGDF